MNYCAPCLEQGFERKGFTREQAGPFLCDVCFDWDKKLRGYRVEDVIDVEDLQRQISDLREWVRALAGPPDQIDRISSLEEQVRKLGSRTFPTPSFAPGYRG